MTNKKKLPKSKKNDNSFFDTDMNKKIEIEKKDLKSFQSAVALSLLKYTSDLENEHVERRLASALLFLTHLSSEITKGFASSFKSCYFGNDYLSKNFDGYYNNRIFNVS